MLSSISEARVLSWYDAHKRDVPWRLTRDPYAIWVSEIMLQQTQVATALPFYSRWIERFPTIESLAAADLQEALAYWQGLGYYRRCRMLLEGARWVLEHGLPVNSKEWLNAPGVGRYTAAAIASICFGERVAVVDGNVARVFARVKGCYAARARLNTEAWIWAQEIIAEDRPGDWNQAMMEIGATVCRPRDPKCDMCPLAEACYARAEGQQERLPVPAPRARPVRVEADAWLHFHEGLYGIEQIPAGDWSEGMWRFCRKPLSEGKIESVGRITHSVTRHRIELDVRVLQCAETIAALRWHTVDELSDVAMPSSERKALALALSRSRVT